MVKHIDCDEKRPLCLYDFTIRSIMIDYLAFRINDFSQIMVDQSYFYGEDYPATAENQLIPFMKSNLEEETKQ